MISIVLIHVLPIIIDGRSTSTTASHIAHTYLVRSNAQLPPLHSLAQMLCCLLFVVVGFRLHAVVIAALSLYLYPDTSASAASQVGAGVILLQLVVLQPSDQSRANDRAPVGAPEK